MGLGSKILLVLMFYYFSHKCVKVSKKSNTFEKLAFGANLLILMKQSENNNKSKKLLILTIDYLGNHARRGKNSGVGII